MKKLIVSVSTIILTLISMSSNVFGWNGEGKVVRIDPTFPGVLHIKLDTTIGECPAGTWLYFDGNGDTSQEKNDTIKAVYAGLLASMYSGKNVEFYLSKPDQECILDIVNLLAN